MICPCGSGAAYAECCEPFIKTKAFPDTAEKLMRSRYTAFVTGEIDYIRDTIAPEARKDFDAKSTREWSQGSKWLGLKILSVDSGKPSDKKGTVEFIATYEKNGESVDHHEVAKFRKAESGKWMFVDGDSHTHTGGEGHHHHPKRETFVREAPKVGRNDPCPCGSGKKYKKCCGA